MDMTKSFEKLMRLSSSLQLPAPEDIILVINSSVFAPNFSDTDDKKITFSYVIFYRQAEHVSEEFDSITDCVNQAYVAVEQLYGS